jgi:enoyl-CoA hydratase/carnithine racemase
MGGAPDQSAAADQPTVFGDPNDVAFIRSERSTPHVLLIRIRRAEKRNALSNPMVIEIGRLLQEAAVDPEVRCAVITGGEDIFSAGADIKNFQQYGVTAVVTDPRRVAAWNSIQGFPKPLIAAVNGYALGAGNELALCCDFVVAGSNAKFGQPEVKTGGMPGDGGTQRLPRKVGPNLAAYMIFTGEPIDAATAHRVGYAVEVCEPKQTLIRAMEIAAVIASRAPFAVRSTKACIEVAVGATPTNGLAFERAAIVRNHASADRAEGMAAFLEKRPPNFKGA